jgi:alpha-amylase
MHAASQEHRSGGVASIHDLVKTKEEGLEKILVNDGYPHTSFVDHFLDGSATLDGFAQCRYGELGDFVKGPYVPKWKKKPDGAEIEFARDGFVAIGDTHAPVRLRKRFSLRPADSKLSALYEVESDFQLSGPLWFGVELVFAFTSPNDPECVYAINGKNPPIPFLNSMGSEEDVREFALSDKRQGYAVRVVLDQPAAMWRFPLETVSLSENGFERVYQGSVVLVHWKISLKPGEPFRVKLAQAVEGI